MAISKLCQIYVFGEEAFLSHNLLLLGLHLKSVVSAFHGCLDLYCHIIIASLHHGSLHIIEGDNLVTAAEHHHYLLSVVPIDHPFGCDCSSVLLARVEVLEGEDDGVILLKLLGSDEGWLFGFHVGLVDHILFEYT